MIEALLRESELPASVQEKSLLAFRCLAEAEARVHGTTIDKIHFHEVGAVDSIIDTVGVVLALHLLGVEDVYASELPYSTGFVRCAHGMMPVPAPATLEMLKGVQMRPSSIRGELITPTGACLLKALALGFGPPPAFIPRLTGYGAGTKEFADVPNVVRVVIGAQAAGGLPAHCQPSNRPPVAAALPKATQGQLPGELSRSPAEMQQMQQNLDALHQRAMPQQHEIAPVRQKPAAGEAPTAETANAAADVIAAETGQGRASDDAFLHESMVVLQCNIDDMNPQIMDYVSAKLFDAGAKDVWMQPIYMKKGRPAVTLSALAPTEQREQLVRILVKESSSLGVRSVPVERLSVAREMRAVHTAWGQVNVKVGLLDGQPVNAHPEYEDCRAVAAKSGAPLKEVFKVIEAEGLKAGIGNWHEHLLGSPMQAHP